MLEEPILCEAALQRSGIGSGMQHRHAPSGASLSLQHRQTRSGMQPSCIDRECNVHGRALR